MRKMTFIKFLMAIMMNQSGNGLMGGDGGGSQGGEGGGGAPDPNDGGANTGGGPNDGNDGGQGGGEGGGADQIPWPEGLDETLKGDETLTRHFNKEKNQFDIPGIMKALVHNKKMVGKEKVQKPQKDWTQDDYKDFYRQIGVPEQTDQYNFDPKKGLEENDKVDESLVENFKSVAHENGLLPHQAEGVIKFYNENMKSQQKALEEQAMQEFREGKDRLEKQYGTALPGKLDKAWGALEAVADNEVIDKLRQKGLVDDPDFSELMIRFADSMDEGNFKSHVQNHTGMTPEDAAEELQALYKKDTKMMSKEDKARHFDKISKLAKIKRGARAGQKGGNSAIM